MEVRLGRTDVVLVGLVCEELQKREELGVLLVLSKLYTVHPKNRMHNKVPLYDSTTIERQIDGTRV